MLPALHSRADPSRPLLLSNTACPYCGTRLSRNKRTKDHVIGRRFVPKGTLERSWNLHVWACQACNRRKSDLEDDISSITIVGAVSDADFANDAELRIEAERKAKRSISRRTGKSVAKSHEQLRVRAARGLLTLTGSFTAPPQLDDARTHELARLQMLAFHHFLTFGNVPNHGQCWRGGFLPLYGTVRPDWGNDIHVEFARRVQTWDYRLVVTTAGGYFRAAIRKHPSADAWSWALEWNGHYRLVGLYGDEQSILAFAQELPKLNTRTFAHDHQGNWIKYRTEVRLAEADDVLFFLPSEGEV